MPPRSFVYPELLVGGRTIIASDKHNPNNPPENTLWNGALGKGDFAEGFIVNGAHHGIIRLVPGVPSGIDPDIIVGLQKVLDEGFEVIEVL